MADSLRISEKVQAVAGMARPDFVSEWQVQFGGPPPPKLRVELMRPVIVYRIQEKAFGLSARDETVESRTSLAMRIVEASRQVRRSSVSGGANFTRSPSQPRVIYITVDLYKGLSPIAFRTTGTRWSGPAFFGTKAKEGSR